MSLVVAFTASCNKDDEGEVSPEQIRQALFDMKGRYRGETDASFYQGSRIAKIESAEALSRETLSFMMPLEPLAGTITDTKIAAALRSAESVEVVARYDFYQIDDGGSSVFFTLAAQNIIVPANGDVPAITIIFADSFGGSFHKDSNFFMFNLSPKEILVGGVQLDSFKQLVYHFGGESE